MGVSGSDKGSKGERGEAVCRYKWSEWECMEMKQGVRERESGRLYVG